MGKCGNFFADFKPSKNGLTKAVVAHFYPEVNHGFHNNTTARFDDAAASLAWSRTISFFKDKLK